MKRIACLLIAATAVSTAAETVAQRRSDGVTVRERREGYVIEMRRGRRGDGVVARELRRERRVIPVRRIERMVLPRMRGAQYLGFDLDFATSVYTLKFLRNGRVIWVLVDGRSGALIGRTGR